MGISSARVPEEFRSRFPGHLPDGADATTSPLRFGGSPPLGYTNPHSAAPDESYRDRDYSSDVAIRIPLLRLTCIITGARRAI